MPGELNYTYRVYDLIVSSELEIKELKPCEATSAVDFSVKFADLELLQQHEFPAVSFSTRRQEVVYPGVGAFVIDGLDKVYIERAPDVSDAFLAVPLLGPVLAILLHLKRHFVLHGSAVIYDGKAYGFVGDKGAGKSTLAAMLLKNPEVEFLTDDLLVVTDDLQVLRGYPQMKLSDEALHHADQNLGRVRPPPINRFPKNQFLLKSHLPDGGVPIGGIFELVRSTKTEIEHLDMKESIRTLLRFSYMARFEERELSDLEKRDLFRSTTLMAASGRIKRLQVPKQIEALDRVIDKFQEMSK